ncbi:PREDICTED: protein ABHD11 [Nicrophorus vespilloides]|uniref:sn-1-specific diacylglycerol lipase ABHD11 n=1 Tax=Nicrophorus vespilloides TaxID=110193 RepID=A0ABM1N5C4_NICVS|nr:PREDICTED: protein ABHD11 [Nicrophorus vespilloides]
MLFTTVRSSLKSIYHKAAFSTKANPKSNVEPVKLAFASYEATSGVEGPPPLVIMHGLFGSKGNWNSLCKVYHQKTLPPRKIFAVDARNHGDSPHSSEHTYRHLAEDIKAFMDSFKIKKASLMGHSMGGRAMMLFSLHYPEMVDKLIVADISPVQTSPSLSSMPGLFDLMLTTNLPKSGAMSTARNKVEMQLATKISDKGLRQFLLTNLIQKSDGSFAWRINIQALVANFKNNIAAFPSTNDLTFGGPVLFVGGGASDYIQKNDHRQIKKIFPAAKFHYIDGAGHWLHSEKPAEFLKTTLDFLNSK